MKYLIALILILLLYHINYVFCLYNTFVNLVHILNITIYDILHKNSTYFVREEKSRHGIPKYLDPNSQ